MDGDLSLSQSLGGLRIANPDDSSSPPPSGDDAQPQSSQDHIAQTNLAASSSNGAAMAPLPDSQMPAPDQESSDRPLSQLDFDPAAYSIDNVVTPPAQSLGQNDGVSLARESSTHYHNDSRSPAVPAMRNFPPQAEQQYPQYTSAGLSPARPHHGGGRPPSSVYAGPPLHPMSASPHTRDETYRLHKANSQNSLSGAPRRHASRAAAVMQAGVPSREGSHSDRTYKNAQMPRQNGSLPPRRSSRGVGNSAGMSSQGIEEPLPRTKEEWQERGAATAMRQEYDPTGKPVQRPMKKGVTDFTFGRELGQGSYSTVVMATDRQTGREYAIKILDKKHIIKEKKVKYVNIEKDTLNRLTEHPGVVRLYYTFQDQMSLYFVLDVAANGELLGVLKRMGTFSEECSRFYGAQILDTVDYMHSQGVIHRDLKPENVLMDDQMHIKITDFGTAKILETPKSPPQGSAGVPLADVDSEDSNRAVSFVGTAEYVSPELLTEKNAGKPSDLWAFGCIIYQLLAGRPPFKAGTEYLTFQKIVALEYSFPTGFPPVAKDLVERLLVLDPARRLTIEHVKNHEFFDGIKWGRGLWQQKAPKLKSYQPPGPGTIKLNGRPDEARAPYPDVSRSHSTKPVHISASGGSGATAKPSRPAPRLITEIPPPSQLDIEWSPVLTRNNERILKFANQLVLTTAAPSDANAGRNNGHNGEGNRFARFFGSGANKKRQRLVLVTSGGRILICGEEKKTKSEISLLDSSTVWKKLQDSKGLSYWMVETPDKHFSFEDPKAASSDSGTTSASADDWIEHIEKAREVAMSQSMSSSYSGDEAWRAIKSSAPGSSSNTLDASDRHNESASSSRHTLQKFPSSNNSEELRGFKRFSKRQSKSGLAAVF